MTKSHSKKFKHKGIGSRALGLDSMSPKELLKKADEYYERLNPNKALFIYDKVITKLSELSNSDENNTIMLDALQSSANILVLFDRVDEAIARFKRAIEMSPNDGYEKYMSLAQLLTGEEAVNLYRNGMEIIRNNISSCNSDDSSTIQRLKRDLSVAHCAVAEVYMIDLRDLSDTAEIVQGEISNAIEVDPSNPQAWYIKASGLFLIERFDEAKESIEKCLSLYLPKVEQLSKDRNEADSEDGDSDGAIDVLTADLEEISGMPFDKHFEISSLLMELQMFQQAEKVLLILYEIDDTHPNVMFQLALVGKELYGESDPETLRMYVTQALKVCRRDPEADLMCATLEEILSELPPAEVEDDDDNGDEDSSDEESDSKEEEGMETD